MERNEIQNVITDVIFATSVGAITTFHCYWGLRNDEGTSHAFEEGVARGIETLFGEGLVEDFGFELKSTSPRG